MGLNAVRLLTVVSLTAGGVAAGTGAAYAAICDKNNPAARGDLDGDARPDVVVGLPEMDGDTGAVDARGTHTDSRVLRAADLKVGTGKGDRFGAAVVITDLDGDGCADLVIGAPGEGAPPVTAKKPAGDKAAAKRFGAGRAGQVHIVFGSPLGLVTKGAGLLVHEASGNGDQFGAALAVVPRKTKAGVVRDLYVGAPGADVGKARDAGEVFRFTISKDAKRRIAVQGGDIRRQGERGVGDSSEPGDHFGSVLAAVEGGTNSNGVLVGVPDEDVEVVGEGSQPTRYSLQDAGAVHYLRTTKAGAPARGQVWTQDSAGLPSGAEAGDRLGAAVASRQAWAAVGIPGEDLDTITDAGMVQAFERSTSGDELFAPRQTFTQESTDGPGELEAGDGFGSAVAVGLGLSCNAQPAVAIGAPGEDVGTLVDAGSVTIAGLKDRAACWPRVLTQGSNGMTGEAEEGDRFGASVAALRGNAAWGAKYTDKLIISAPGEDLDSAPDAGTVQQPQYAFTVNGADKPWLEYSGGLKENSRYGEVLTGTSD